MKTIARFKKDKEKFLSETAVVSIIAMLCLTTITVLLVISSFFYIDETNTTASLVDTTGTQTIIQGDNNGLSNS